MAKSNVLAATLLAGGIISEAVGRTHRQVRQHRKAWEAQNFRTLNQLKQDDFLLVALGDSATQGVGAARIDQSYVARLAQMIPGSVRVVNLSISGATIETILAAQLPQLRGLELKPDLVVANIGGNDVGAPHITPELFSGYAKRMARELPGPALVGNIPSFSFLPREQLAAELSAILDEQMSAAGHVPVDLRRLSQQYSTWEYLTRYHAPDLFHPNARAYAAWALEFGSHL